MSFLSQIRKFFANKSIVIILVIERALEFRSKNVCRLRSKHRNKRAK